MTVLITGAGLIGCHLANRIVNRGEKVVLYDLSPDREYILKVAGRDSIEVVAADLRDLPALINSLKRFNIDMLVHTAGLIGKRVAENTYTGTTNNILGTVNVLEAAKLHGPRRLVYVSTFGVYDRSKIKKGPIREEAPVTAHNLYTATKLCSEHLFHAYSNLYAMDMVIIRPAGVFGKGHYVGGSTVGMVMRDLTLNIIKGAPFSIDAKIFFPNEYVYAKDVALAIDLACQARNVKERVYNVGSGVVTSASDLAQVVRQLAPKVKVELVGAESGDSHSVHPLGLNRSKDELGYSPQFPMKEALQDYMKILREDGARERLHG